MVCHKLKFEGPVGEMFLEELNLEACDYIDDMSPELLPREHILWVQFCDILIRFLIHTTTKTLNIFGCENVEKLSVACGNLPSAIMRLNIYGCSKLKCLPERMQELFPSLNTLSLSGCPEIESFPEGGLPFNLQVLHISNCTKLVNGRKEWRLPYLRELFINHDGSDEEILAWELPSSIQRLTIRNLKTLSSQLVKSLTSLKYLFIDGNSSQIQSLLEQGQLPSYLSELRLDDHHDLHSLHLCHHTSLQILYIQDCPSLQSLSESSLPSSLSHLSIINCPNLRFLPINGMPSSLSRLDIRNCPLLTPQVEFDKGEYWPNIAQIPIVEIDWKYL